jgi:hypothetical protein
MGEWRYSSIILDLGTRWRRVASFTPRDGARVKHWMGGWVDLRAALEAEKRNISCPAGNRTPVVQPVAHCYTD